MFCADEDRILVLSSETTGSVIISLAVTLACLPGSGNIPVNPVSLAAVVQVLLSYREIQL